MSVELLLGMAQIGPFVGDISGNLELIRSRVAEAREAGCDLVVFPELAVTGYPPEDLLLRPEFLRQIATGVAQLAADLADITVVLGCPEQVGGALFNSAVVLRDGAVVGSYHKQLLPNYSVFDEKRYFTPGEAPLVVDVRGVQVGITVCEDVWGPAPVAAAVDAGAEFIVNINASPYHTRKAEERQSVIGSRARENRVPVVYVNMVGGQDELVFDGGSFVVDGRGQLQQLAPDFEEGLYLARFSLADGVTPLAGTLHRPASFEAGVYKALVTGVRDYINKNGFRGGVVGLSGGIDSALTLAIAVDALGAERVEAVMMPSRYTAQISRDDARAEAEALGVKYSELPIGAITDAAEAALATEFVGLEPDVTEENIQARARGLLLMAIANKKRTIVLTTGNKSEMAVGYATLYGDMVGGFAVIKDVPKMLVYRLSEYRNLQGRVIPERVLTRAPSAELKPDQTDQDLLPPYPLLDAILEMYVEQDRSTGEIVAALDVDRGTVERIVTMVNRSEYKRRQAPPGVRISKRAFGRDRRYPITSGFSSTEG